MTWFEYCGNCHVHSSYSDGSADLAQIAGAAASAGLDFVIMTDHGSLTALDKGEEGYYGKVLVLVGMEANQTCSHYLALDISKDLQADDRQPQKVIDQVNEQGGIGIIAHPMDKGCPLLKNSPGYPWLDWSVQGFQGLEIWNLLSTLLGSTSNVIRGLCLMMNPHAGLKAPDLAVIKRWDDYNTRGARVIAYGGSDAHGVRGRGIGQNFASYHLAFRCINLHLLCELPLCGDLIHDRKNLYEVLRRGRFWIADDYIWKSTGFSFVLTRGKEVWNMGEQAAWKEGIKAVIHTPRRSRVNLIRNGRLYAAGTGCDHSFPGLPPGVYRVEVQRRHLAGRLPWIFSNPIWVAAN